MANTLFKKYRKQIASALLILLILCAAWMFMHEVSHSAVCYALGGVPSLNQIYPHPSINCNGLDSVNNTEYFLLAMAPYVLAFALLVIIFLNKNIIKNIRLRVLLTFVLFIDISLNYLSLNSLLAFDIKACDFYRLLLQNGGEKLFLIGIALSMLTVLITFFILKRDLPALIDKLHR